MEIMWIGWAIESVPFKAACINFKDEGTLTGQKSFTKKWSD